MPQPTPEYIYVEKPTIDQLQSMGWQYIEGSWDNPQLTNRENFKQVLISDHLRSILDSQITTFVNRVGASPRSVQVRELGYRWGSCGHKGNLYFHWRVAMLPRMMIEYVVVHELMHLIEPHHTNAFWDRVERILSDWCDRKQWLAQNGASYDF